MEKLPNELLVNICQNLKVSNRIKLELINNNFKNLVRNYPWDHLILTIKKIKTIVFVKDLGNCHTLNLASCKLITDSSIKHLKKCHTLDLSWGPNITNENVQYLTKCHTLNLNGCTDESIKYLGNCHRLNLRGCCQITEAGAIYLGKCRELNLSVLHVALKDKN